MPSTPFADSELIWSRIIRYRLIIVIFFLLASAYFLAQIPHLRLEVSADALVLENDKAYDIYKRVNAQYGEDDFIVVTYQPQNTLFSAASLRTLNELHAALEAVEGVRSVNSILNVPLLFSPPLSLTQLNKALPRLGDENVNISLAKLELSSSPLYGQRLLSEDLSTTALQVLFEEDSHFLAVREQRDVLREQVANAATPTRVAELATVERQYREQHSALIERQSRQVVAIKAIAERFRSTADIHIGGLPLIVVDMMTFIAHDIEIFGTLVVLSMAVLLWWAFRSWHWLVLPLLGIAVTAIWVAGMLALLDWPVTAVSANFVALLIIFAMSLHIHLIVQFREYQHASPELSVHDLLLKTLIEKFAPSFYTVLTTAIAFLALVFSDIRPVIDFGLIMVLALIVCLSVCFLLFPALIACAPKPESPRLRPWTANLMNTLSKLAITAKTALPGVFLISALITLFGLTRLSVDNRFIDYFDDTTEIYQGMVTIDRYLGGTTPLDILIDAPTQEDVQTAPDNTAEISDPFGEDPFAGDPFATAPFGNEKDPFAGDPFSDQSATGNSDVSTSAKQQPYWLRAHQLELVRALHRKVEEFSDTGKVLSLDTTITTLEKLNKGRALDDFFLHLFHENLSDELQETLIAPYLSDDGRQLRINVRVFETSEALDRQGLLSAIESELGSHPAMEGKTITMSGMMVLYNNLLQSLFDSQIKTLTAVFAAIFVLFVALFRSMSYALIAITPNVFTAIFVLGLIGLSGIPLDIMTITVAGISVGIAVDDTIHYLHRYRGARSAGESAVNAIGIAHRSIGRAMFYTSLTIALGFAVMTLSQFSPTIYFGIFTACAMVTAMLANMLLLPFLLLKFESRSHQP